MREVLANELAPAMATAILFDALDRWGRGVPADSAQMLELVRGPLASILTERLGAERSTSLIEMIELRLQDAPDEDLELDIEFGEDDEDTGTALVAAVPHPVTVLVVSASDGFSERLLTTLGPIRVYPHTVSDEAAFRHASFSMVPLIAVVDAVDAPAIRPPSLAKAMKSLPNATLGVLWGDETEYGRELRRRLEDEKTETVFLDRKDGIEPFFDLVLSRYKKASVRPPPKKDQDA